MLEIIQATLADYPVIQNMARFYLYDLSRYCGHTSKDWAIQADGLYECFDFKDYFEDTSCKAYLVKVDDELAGFVLLDQNTLNKDHLWNMGQFFILARFQGRGISTKIACNICDKHKGTWEVAVIPENKKAHYFWQKTIKEFTNNNFHEEIKDVTYDEHQPKRIIFTFSV